MGCDGFVFLWIMFVIEVGAALPYLLGQAGSLHSNITAGSLNSKLLFEGVAGFGEVGAVGVAAVELLKPAFYESKVGGGVTNFVVFFGGEFSVEVGHIKCFIFRIILRHQGYMDVWRDVVGYVFQGVDGVFDVVGQH